jgi:hypothetical protein
LERSSGGWSFERRSSGGVTGTAEDPGCNMLMRPRVAMWPFRMTAAMEFLRTNSLLDISNLGSTPA